MNDKKSGCDSLIKINYNSDLIKCSYGSCDILSSSCVPSNYTKITTNFSGVIFSLYGISSGNASHLEYNKFYSYMGKSNNLFDYEYDCSNYNGNVQNKLSFHNIDYTMSNKNNCTGYCNKICKSVTDDSSNSHCYSRTYGSKHKITTKVKNQKVKDCTKLKNVTRKGDIINSHMCSSEIQLHLSDINKLESAILLLYDDRICPTWKEIQRKLRELDCSSCDARICLYFYKMISPNYIVEINDDSGQHNHFSVYLRNPPESFLGWIDPYDSRQPYSDDVWLSFIEYLNLLMTYKYNVSYFLQNYDYCLNYSLIDSKSNSVKPWQFKCGRYHAAVELRNRGLKFLEGLCLGEVSHLVQKAINIGILAYENDVLQPISGCQKMTVAAVSFINKIMKDVPINRHMNQKNIFVAAVENNDTNVSNNLEYVMEGKYEMDHTFDKCRFSNIGLSNFDKFYYSDENYRETFNCCVCGKSKASDVLSDRNFLTTSFSNKMEYQFPTILSSISSSTSVSREVQTALPFLMNSEYMYGFGDGVCTEKQLWMKNCTEPSLMCGDHYLNDTNGTFSTRNDRMMSTMSFQTVKYKSLLDVPCCIGNTVPLCKGSSLGDQILHYNASYSYQNLFSEKIFRDRPLIMDIGKNFPVVTASALGFPHLGNRLIAPVQQIDDAKFILTSVLLQYPNGIIIGSLKLKILERYNVYICPTLFGYTRLSPLLSSEDFSDVSRVLQDSQNRQYVQSVKFNKPPGLKLFVSKKCKSCRAPTEEVYKQQFYLNNISFEYLQNSTKKNIWKNCI